MALVKDTLGEAHLTAHHVAGKGLASGGAAHAAVDLRQVHLELVDAFELLVGFGEVFVEGEHGAGLYRLDG